MLSHIREIKCSSLAKYTLMKSIMTLGQKVTHGLPLNELMEQVGLARKTFFRALRELRELEVATPTSRSYGRYSPGVVKFNISAGAISAATVQMKENLHHPFISALLKEEVQQEESSTPKDVRLKIAQKVLLIALFEAAKPGGKVLSLGFSDLSDLTGLNKRRIQNQVSLLTNQGYILGHIKGFNAPAPLGRHKSIYYLNIHHVRFDKTNIYHNPNNKVFIFDPDQCFDQITFTSAVSGVLGRTGISKSNAQLYLVHLAYDCLSDILNERSLVKIDSESHLEHKVSIRLESALFTTSLFKKYHKSQNLLILLTTWICTQLKLCNLHLKTTGLAMDDVCYTNALPLKLKKKDVNSSSVLFFYDRAT